MPGDVPQAVLDVLADEKAREVLLKVAFSRDPPRYSEVRNDLGLHPQEFQRTLERLEDLALILTRAPLDPQRSTGERRNVVLLEATSLGEFVADYWEKMGSLFAKRAQQLGISAGSLAALDRIA